MSELTPGEKVLAALIARDVTESLDTAIGWVCVVGHVDHPDFPPTIWGVCPDLPSALAWAASHEAELNSAPGEAGFKVTPYPVLPLGEGRSEDF